MMKILMMIMIISPFGQVYDDDNDNKLVFFFFSLGVRDVFTTAYVFTYPRRVIEDILVFTHPRSRDILVVWAGSTLCSASWMKRCDYAMTCPYYHQSRQKPGGVRVQYYSMLINGPALLWDGHNNKMK
jgi:hypothetical protein